MFAVEGVEIRLMLEEVGVELPLLHLQIRLNVVREYADLQIHALRLQQRLDELENLGMGYGGGRDLQYFVGGRRVCHRCDDECESDETFEHGVPWVRENRRFNGDSGAPPVGRRRIESAARAGREWRR